MNTKPCIDNEHQWIEVYYGLYHVCQFCNWRKSLVDGHIEPPAPSEGDGVITD